MASNVNLIDPNSVNINTTVDSNGVPFVNGIPQYQDMYIFAELKAKSRGRTVIVTTNDGNVSQGVFKTGFENPKEINLLGVNQNNQDNNPNYLKFTTNYYDGSTGNYTQYESFGINNIKVTINSSFVPQVNIQFIDIRGLSFFNQEGSPYRIIFDFPPPIFELSFKGYYGKTLTYRLHLVKYTSEFQSDSGNFVIDAQFIAVTYAPLTDILLRYIINSPLIGNPVNVTPTTDVKPQNTYELILKLKNLYTSISDKIKTDVDSKKYDSTLKNINDINSTIAILANYREDSALKKVDIPYLITKTSDQSFVLRQDAVTQNEDGLITQLQGLFEYDEKIKGLATEGAPNTVTDRLFVVFPAQLNLGPVLTTNAGKIQTLNTALIEFQNKLINRTSEILGTDKSILKSQLSTVEFDNFYNVTSNKEGGATTKYVGLDVTDYYISLFKQKIQLTTEKINISKNLTSKINSMVSERLGMMPTIYNIFKIILDDVDTFFEQLRKVSIEAENNHHNIEANKNIIIGDSYADFPSKIFAFPLIVDREKTVCGGNKEERIAPIELSKRTTTPFPEMKFINDFIDTFFTQRRLDTLATMRSKEDADGNREWLPISPFDSTLGTDDSKSPYINVDTTTGNVNLSEDNRLSQILKIVLQRFYVLSQSSIPNSFYNTIGGKRDGADKAYVKLYAESEAVNLASSVTNTTYGNNLKAFAESNKNNIDNFYNVLNDNVPSFYDFSDDAITSINVSDTKKAYVDKNNPEYEGVSIYEGDIIKQTIEAESDKPIDKFKNSVQRTRFGEIFAGRRKEVFYDFTKENVQYVRDVMINKKGNETNDNIDDNDGNNIITRFLTNASFFIDTDGTGIGHYPSISSLVSGGNQVVGGVLGSDAQNLRKFENIVDIWVNQLSKKYGNEDFDDIIYDEIISTPSKLSALLILSNFGHAVGFFNKYPNNLNGLIFNIPAAIEVPKFLPLYIGALIDAKESTTPWFNDIINFFSGGTGKILEDIRSLILADYSDVNKYMSVTDKELFQQAFSDYYANGANRGDYYILLSRIQTLYNDVKNGEERKNRAYENFLNPKKDGTHYRPVLQTLIERTNLIVFSQDTFKMSEIYPVGYKSIKSLNDASANNKAVNDEYFQIFLSKLFGEIVSKENEIKKQEEEDNKKRGDIDIITQTYYSFKNINDKWLSGPTENNIHGFPFNTTGKALIDSFVFVDRAMNPIGDTILNAELLVQLFDDPNVTVFSALSQLLSLNGFEFFPLQNFMIHDNSWEDTFKIDTNGDIKQRAAFVCMYIGGTSSYPTNVGNNFTDDGIIDIGNTDTKDFTTQECFPNQEDDNQIVNNQDFPYRQVRAFRVKFGEQNQSMFTNIKIDSKEYPETNESIQILSRLAGDNQQDVPVPKGQNLYNLYENRSYKATVTGLGNAMIQPTQYFQLENVPLFNGAYVILSVEHDIVANRMTTSFSGTKIMRYPVPRVKSPIAFIGFDGGESNDTSISSMSAGQLVAATDIIDTEKKIQYLSMYNFNIQ